MAKLTHKQKIYKARRMQTRDERENPHSSIWFSKAWTQRSLNRLAREKAKVGGIKKAAGIAKRIFR